MPIPRNSEEIMPIPTQFCTEEIPLTPQDNICYGLEEYFFLNFLCIILEKVSYHLSTHLKSFP
jgi:hypothetical protein